MIFLPGFSTAEKVTNVSGRGVGMDVVKTNIEKIGGTVDLQSRLGQGTTLKIKIPLTLAIIPAFIVNSGGDRYAIPQVSLLELVRLEGGAGHAGSNRSTARRSIGCGASCCRWSICQRDWSSSRPADGAGNGRSDGASILSCCRPTIANSAWLSTTINDTEEIVVKPLQQQLKGLCDFAGATIMGDGTIALILDVMGLAVAAGLAGECANRITPPR